MHQFSVEAPQICLQQGLQGNRGHCGVQRARVGASDRILWDERHEKRFFFYRQPGTVYSQITRQNVKTGFARQTTATADLAAKKVAHPGRRSSRRRIGVAVTQR